VFAASPARRQERALSSDHLAHRFVFDATVAGPKQSHPVLNDWQLGTILTLESPHYFTKFVASMPMAVSLA